MVKGLNRILIFTLLLFFIAITTINLSHAEDSKVYQINGELKFGLAINTNTNDSQGQAHPTISLLAASAANTSVGDASIQLAYLKSFKQEKNDWSNPIPLDNATTYTHDSKLLFHFSEIQHTSNADVETWTVDIIFPDGTSHIFPPITWYKSFQGKSDCFVWGSQYILAENTTVLYGDEGWIEDTRNNNGRPGVWKLNVVHDSSLVGTVNITRRVGADPESVVFGSTFNQGSYGDYSNELHHMDTACRNPGDKSSHTCNKAKYPNEHNTTIRNTGCAMTSCCVMLNFYGIKVTPIELNAWLKSHNGYGEAGDIDWPSVATYARSNGVNLKYDGPIPSSKLEYYLCWYGPQVIRVAGHAHFVCLYGKDTENHWVIEDPSGGQKIPLKNKYSGMSSIRGFSLLQIPYTPLPGLCIAMHSPAEILIIDAQGRRTGYDPNTGQTYDEIPEAFYYTEGYDDDETDEPTDHETKFLYINNLSPTKYTVKVTGTAQGTYDLTFRGYQTDENIIEQSFDEIETSPNLVHTYELSFDGTPGSSIHIDGGPPVTPDQTPPVTVADYPSDWVNQDVNVTLAATDNKSGVKATYFRIDGDSWETGNQILINKEGIHNVNFYSTDNAGNVENTKTITIKIDKTSPESKVEFKGSLLSDGTYQSAVTAILSASDNGSGIKSICYGTDANSSLYVEPFVINNEGENTFWVYAVDNAGNKETYQYHKITIVKTSDITPPITTATYSTDWVKDNVIVTLEATDDKSGVKGTFYRLDASPWQTGTRIEANSDGIHLIEFYSVDYDNNVEPINSISVKVDKTAPHTTLNLQGEQLNDGSYRSFVTVTLLSDDKGSGLKNIYYRLSPNDNYTQYSSPFTVSKEGENELYYYAIDAAGNQENLQSNRFVITNPQFVSEYSLLCSQLTLYGNMNGDSLYVNGPITIYGNGQWGFLGTTEKSFTITGQQQISDKTINGEKQTILQPNWQALFEATSLDNRTFCDSASLSKCWFPGGLSTSGTTTLSGITVVQGDLTFNGNVIMDNAAIFCSGKITVNACINGTGLIYSGAGLTIWGNSKFTGKVLISGPVVMSGTETFLISDVDNYTVWFK